jgi:RND superfamily putative drug exporter
VIAWIGGRPDVAVADVYPDGSPQDASTTDLLHRVRSQVVPAAARGTGLRVLSVATPRSSTTLAMCSRASCPVHRSSGVPQLPAVDGRLPEHRRPAHRGGDEPTVGRRRPRRGGGRVSERLGRVVARGRQGGPIEPFLPVLLFPILFGLSMDYEVLLISRIYEEWQRRGDTREAVAHGLAATGRTITAAGDIAVVSASRRPCSAAPPWW